MKDELVTFETTKLAKEKGFEGNCAHWTCIGFNTLEENREIRRRETGSTVSKIGKGQTHIALVPTQALLQKWLRDKHGIHVWLIPAETDKTYRAYVGRGIKLDLLTCSNTESFELYEEALEVGLQHALNLI